MKLKRVVNGIIPPKGYIALTIWPWVIIRKENASKYTPTANRHEITHAYQQLECLWVLFFIWYIMEWFIKIPICYFACKDAYRSISFEQEAYANQGKVDYNKNRKHYAWMKYIFKLK